MRYNEVNGVAMLTMSVNGVDMLTMSVNGVGMLTVSVTGVGMLTMFGYAVRNTCISHCNDMSVT